MCEFLGCSIKLSNYKRMKAHPNWSYCEKNGEHGEVDIGFEENFPCCKFLKESDGKINELCITVKNKIKK